MLTPGSVTADTGSRWVSQGSHTPDLPEAPDLPENKEGAGGRGGRKEGERERTADLW